MGSRKRFTFFLSEENGTERERDIEGAKDQGKRTQGHRISFRNEDWASSRNRIFSGG